MKIQLLEIMTQNSFKSPELIARAQESTKSPKTIHYRALIDCDEAAFVSLDRWAEPEVRQMVLYEIFVPRLMRRRGIATAVLAEIERIAMEEGFQKICLRPSPLDHKLSQKELSEWYRRRGYDWDPLICGDMVKQLNHE